MDHPTYSTESTLARLTRKQENHTVRTYASDCCVHELFEQQLRNWPGSVAAIFGHDRLSYQELNSRANQLAHYLRKRGVGPDVLVGICVERSMDMLVGVLGTLKAGGAYVPLDPAYPKDRLAYLLEDAGAPVLLTQEHLVSRMPPSHAEIILLDSDWSAIRAQAADNLEVSARPENLAYVIYTSGSTGRPKGVCLPHRALVNLLRWQLEQSKAGLQDRTLQFTSLSFDVSFQEIFSTWCSGGTLLLISEALRRDPIALLGFLKQEKIARLFLPFVALQQLAAAAEAREVPSDLREVITAGEQLRITPQIASLFARMSRCTLFNHYGPSESHVATSYALSGAPDTWDALPAIGKPISNTQIHILDSSLKPVPSGEPGELYIGGIGLARGYHNRSNLSAERFIVNPFENNPADRLYKTGDLCRYLPDGNIQYLGRTDDQVKIRGYRIELGEVESVLATHPGVHQCAVTAREDLPGNKKLLAYLVARPGRSPLSRDLRNFLATKLPDYMIPSGFVILDAMPLTPSGKIDRRALPTPTRDNSALEQELVAPRNQLERDLAGICEQVLGIKPIGVTDNIFELGIDSLLAVRLFARIEKELGKELPPGSLFQAPTVEALAVVLQREKVAAPWTSMVPIQPNGSKTPLFCVHGGTGTVFGFYELARCLAPDRPVYGFQSQGLYGKDLPHRRIEDMAAHYIQEMRTVQARGPYLLGGWCFGGIVAFEMAQQLHQAGESVDLLSLFHAPSSPEYNAPNMQPEGPRRAGARLQTRELPGHFVLRVFGRIKWRTRQFQRRIAILALRLSRPARFWFYEYYVRRRRPLPASVRKKYFLRLNVLAERQYRAQPYAGNAVVFRNQEIYPDPFLGWGRFVKGDIEAFEIPVLPPRALIEGPTVGLVAHHLEEYLFRKSGMQPMIDQHSNVIRGSVSVAQKLESNVAQ